MATIDIRNADTGNTTVSHGGATVWTFPSGTQVPDIVGEAIPIITAVSGKYLARFDDYSYY